MCKSKDEPGGPYRCSGDMRNQLRAAVTNYQTATRAAAEASVAFEAAKQEQARAQAAHDAHVNEGDLGGTTASRAQVTAATLRVQEVADRLSAAQQPLRTAANQVAAAERDYQATPRGVADLQYRIDQTQEQIADSEPAARKALQERQDTLVADQTRALTTMNAEARERSRRWGTEDCEYEAPTPEIGVGASLAQFSTYSHQDGLSVTIINRGRDDNGLVRRDVTIHRSGDGRAKTMKVTHRSAVGSPPPSRAEIIRTACTKASAAQDSLNKSGSPDYRTYRKKHPDATLPETQARERFAEGKTYAARLDRLLGPERHKYYDLCRGT